MTLVKIYRCLCDETRLRILHLLQDGPLCVCHFQKILGLHQVAVSKQLAYLRRHAMVVAERHERWMVYSLPPNRPPGLHRQLKCLQDCVQTDPKFQRDERRRRTLSAKCDWVSETLSKQKAPKRKSILSR